jgi:hypothetical protein
MDLGLNGKLALITASSGGIGFEIAREGTHVIKWHHAEGVQEIIINLPQMFTEGIV